MLAAERGAAANTLAAYARDLAGAEEAIGDLVAADPDLALLLSLSNLNPDTAFLLTDLQNQIQSTASRLVLFIGGNDVRGVYGDIYNGGPSESFVQEFLSDAAEILDRVVSDERDVNPEAIEVLVHRLRKRLAGSQVRIGTLRGLGYVLEHGA